MLHTRIDSYQHLLEVIQERANLQDGKFVHIQRKLKDCTVETLQRERAVWHRTCYSDVNNKAMVQRARDCQQNYLSTGTHREQGPKTVKRKHSERNDGPTSFLPFTRSSTHPLYKNLCFFCQKDTRLQLFNVTMENAGHALRQAVHLS